MLFVQEMTNDRRVILDFGVWLHPNDPLVDTKSHQPAMTSSEPSDLSDQNVRPVELSVQRNCHPNVNGMTSNAPHCFSL
jgi:hypothetical protein